MKTPCREYPLYARDINPENGDVIMAELNPPLYDARWKRKNRVKQLKRSLKKYKHGTHLYGYVGAAYRRLQGVVKPSMKSPITEWLAYMRELQRVQEHVNHAIANAAVYVAEMAECDRLNAKWRKEVKE